MHLHAGHIQKRMYYLRVGWFRFTYLTKRKGSKIPIKVTIEIGPVMKGITLEGGPK